MIDGHNVYRGGWTQHDGESIQFESDCKHTDTQNQKMQNMLFNAYVVQTMLYRVEIWGGNISPSTWNDIEKRKKAFLC